MSTVKDLKNLADQVGNAVETNLAQLETIELKARITERAFRLKTERDAYIAQANQIISGYNAAIGELEKLLQPETPVAPPAEKGGA